MLERIPLETLLRFYRPGSDDWSWDDEERDLLTKPCLCPTVAGDPQWTACGQPGHYQLMLEEYLRSVGRVEQGVCLGNDGRVWDGHHRIVAARRLGFPDIPLEEDSYRPQARGSTATPVDPLGLYPPRAQTVEDRS